MSTATAGRPGRFHILAKSHDDDVAFQAAIVVGQLRLRFAALGGLPRQLFLAFCALAGACLRTLVPRQDFLSLFSSILPLLRCSAIHWKSTDYRGKSNPACKPASGQHPNLPLKRLRQLYCSARRNVTGLLYSDNLKLEHKLILAQRWGCRALAEASSILGATVPKRAGHHRMRAFTGTRRRTIRGGK